MQNNTPSCEDLGIPSHLHQNNESSDPNFDEPEEKYFRRFKPGTQIDLSDGMPSIAVYSATKMSGNREKYSKKPEDVLYNINAKNTGDHFFSWGIVETKIKNIKSLIMSHPTKENSVLTFNVEHDPEKCMYPHTVVNTYENNQKKERINNRSAETEIKKELRKHFCVIKKPDR